MRLVLVSAEVEWIKIMSRNKYRVLLLLEGIICIGLMLFTNKNGLALFGHTMDLPSVPYSILGTGSTLVLPLTIFMLVADLFSGEVENSSIKSVFLKPVSRFKIFLAKMIGIICFIFINLMLICTIMVLGRAVLGGASISYFELIISYVVTIVPLVAVIALSVMIAQFMNSSSMAMFCSLIVYALLKAISLVSIKVAAMIFTSHFGWYRMFLTSQMDFKNILTIFILNLSYIVLFSVGGFLLFDKKEV